jgi:hypothetical protein
MARTNLEIWENVTEALLGLLKLDHRGSNAEVLVRGGGKVSLTPEEREINEAMIPDEKFNPFRNGMLRAVRLTTDPDATPVDSSSALSDEELADFFKKTPAAFAKALKEVDSSVLLQRLIAHGEVNEATVKQVDAVKARLEEVDPPLRQIPVEKNIGV